MKEFLMQMIALKLAEGEVVKHDKTFAKGMHTKHLYFLAAISFVQQIDIWWATTTQLNQIRAGYNRSAFCDALRDLYFSPYVHCSFRGKTFVSPSKYNISFYGKGILEKFIAVQEYIKDSLNSFGYLDIYTFPDISKRTIKYMDCRSFYDASVKFEDVAKYI